MTKPQHFDNIVIGGGSGLTAAYYALQNGQSVALATDRPEAMGGTCVNFGRIPTKTLIQSTRALETIKTAAQFGVDVDTTTIYIECAQHAQHACRPGG